MTATEYRIDRGSLRSPRRNDQGFLLVDAFAARSGILEYPDSAMPGGVRRELREPAVVFDEASLASYEGVPITSDHPSVMLDRSNATEYQRGTVLAPGRQDGDHVAVALVINDGGLIDQIEAGKVQVSAGYKVRYDATPGEHPLYGKFSGRQLAVVLNHVAIVGTGRSGPTVALRLDGVDVPTLIELEPRFDRAEALAELRARWGDRGNWAEYETRSDAFVRAMVMQTRENDASHNRQAPAARSDQKTVDDSPAAARRRMIADQRARADGDRVERTPEGGSVADARAAMLKRLKSGGG